MYGREMVCPTGSWNDRLPPSIRVHKGVSLSRTASSAGPDTDLAASASFDHVAVLNPHPFNNARLDVVHAVFNADVGAYAAVPMAPVGLVVYLDDILAGSRHDVASVEHHAGDGVIIGVGVVDRAGAEVPYLRYVRDLLRNKPGWTYPD